MVQAELLLVLGVGDNFQLVEVSFCSNLADDDKYYRVFFRKLEFKLNCKNAVFESAVNLPEIPHETSEIRSQQTK